MKQIDLSQWLVACYQSFARRIGLTGLVGLLLCCCAFGEGRAPSPTYYDARERAAAALTFEWATTKTVNFCPEGPPLRKGLRQCHILARYIKSRCCVSRKTALAQGIGLWGFRCCA